MENTFLKRITDIKMTKVQLQIADYILKNQKRVLGMTAKDIGIELDVSDASVIRFARAMGYEGLLEMKESLREELKENSEKIGKHSLHDRFVMQTEKYTKKVNSEDEILRLMEVNLETSIRENDEEDYEEIANHILQSDRKIVIGLRGGKGSALKFSRLLGHLTSRVERIIDEGHDSICKLRELDEKDVVIILNFSRYYRIDEKLAQIIKRQKSKIYLITDSLSSPIAKYADKVLLAETEHCGFFHSMIGVEAILEYLLILMCWKDPSAFRERLKERDSILCEYQLENPERT